MKIYKWHCLEAEYKYLAFIELTEARKQVGFRVFYVDTVLPHYEDNRKLKGQIIESID